MHIKIYFKDKPFYLCDDIDEEIAPYVHHDDAIFVDEFSTPAIKSIIHEMKEDKIHAGILYHTNLEDLKKAFMKKFDLIIAAGGLVMNHRKEILMIYRKGKWDLPKGKLDEKESIETCAIREVKEETGLEQLQLLEPLTVTYHSYEESGKSILKECHWYLMQADGNQPTKPQAEEQITEIKWIKQNELPQYLKNSYSLIRDVMKEAGILIKT